MGCCSSIMRRDWASDPSINDAQVASILIPSGTSQEHQNAENMVPEDHSQHVSIPSSSATHTTENSGVQALVSSSPEEAAWIASLLSLDRFERLGDLSDLQQAITSLQTVVRSMSARDDRLSEGLGHLGMAIWNRFKMLGELSDLEEAISTLGRAVRLMPRDHPDKHTFMNILGRCFTTRFQHLGELKDIEDAILALRDAVHLTPHGNPAKPQYASNLGISLITRFDRLGDLSDLGEAISRFKDAVDLTPHGHATKPMYLNNLGNSLDTHFRHFGDLVALEDSILNHKEAVDLTPLDDPHKANYLSGLSNSLANRFERFGESSDLENAISLLRDAIDLTSDGHPHKPGYLNNIGNCLNSRFDRLGELSDLEEAISRYRDAVELSPNGHREKPTYLNNLGNCLRARFERHEELSDIEESISILRDAVNLTPFGHTHKARHLTSLGNSLQSRFDRLGRPDDLENAISILRVAVDVTPGDHPQRSARLDYLGDTLKCHFDRFGRLSDLDEAISTLRDAVDLTPDDYPKKPTRLSNLASSLQSRFECLGELGDLEAAVSMLRDVVILTPRGHPEKRTYLNNLGNSLKIRFHHLRELTDLEDAIWRFKEAIAITPDDHPAQSIYLNNLATSLHTRFDRHGELSDLEEAILILSNIIDLTPHNHPRKHHHLSNLGNFFTTRFESLGELSDIESAISRHGDALALTPHDHADRPRHLNDLGDSFMAHFKHNGKLSALEHAISRFKDAVDLTPHGYPEKPIFLANLGDSLVARFEHTGELSSLGEATSMYFQAASAPTGPIRVRFRASRNWISCARHMGHQSLLDAYSTAISLLPELAWIGLSLSQRFDELTQGADIVREAAAAALEVECPEAALEWLEQGRSIVWGELLQLRSSYEELSTAYPNYARRLRELSVALDHASATREKSLSAISEQRPNTAYPVPVSLQQEANRHRALAIERDELLREIRRLPGFEQFLLQKQFSQLRSSAHSGPAVVLNAAKGRCDALIVLADVDHVIHVPLPAFNVQRSTNLQKMLEKLLEQARVVCCDEREGSAVVRDGISWEFVLSVLWSGVIKPIMDALAFSVTLEDLSRIFWCPTGPFAFLPIHAAGLYDTQYSQPGHKVFDFVVSSYVPTLSILTLAPKPSAGPKDGLHLLAVRQPPSDGLSRLPGVATELEHIRTVIQNSPSTCIDLVESTTGTVEEVLTLMKQADWVHFACHGIQDGADSGLCLADRRRLKLRDIIALSRPHGGLAFLSACQTAMGEERLSDEAIHVAAGMLFAGYESVIGTMWSISDSLAPRVARDVYNYLFRNGTRPDAREAARALHEAIQGVRNSSEASFITWLPFVHIGL